MENPTPLPHGQLAMFPDSPSMARFPSTRYQGSKRKVADWLWQQVEHLEFESCLDLFAGTSCVSYLFKTHGKKVASNDMLRFNGAIARALVANNRTQLCTAVAERLFQRTAGREYRSFIADTYHDVFYTDEENQWLDTVVQNIHLDLHGLEKDLALFALFQACLAKRPYNLFHRANLYMRTSEVKRSFGNKATWDRPFREHFINALTEANRAVFDNGHEHRVTTRDFLEVDGTFDLVYFDPPYTNSRGTGVDYRDFYHFAEGITEYDAWPERITRKYKHIPYQRDHTNPWNDSKRVLEAFSQAIDRYQESCLVISYRSKGVPSIGEIEALLQHHGRRRPSSAERGYKYVLSTKANKEVLLVSEP